MKTQSLSFATSEAKRTAGTIQKLGRVYLILPAETEDEADNVEGESETDDVEEESSDGWSGEKVEQPKHELLFVKGIGQKSVDKLIGANINTVADLAAMTEEDINAVSEAIKTPVKVLLKWKDTAAEMPQK